MTTHTVAAGTVSGKKAKAVRAKTKAVEPAPASVDLQHNKLKLQTMPPVFITEEQREAERRAEDDRRHEERRQESSNAAMVFSMQQLTTPIAAPQAAIEQYHKELEALREKYNIPKEQAQVLRGEKLLRNGITRPAAGTVTGKVWAEADAITVKHGRPATIAELKVMLPQINLHTVKTQYARWRQFNDVKGRVSVVSAPAVVMPENTVL